MQARIKNPALLMPKALEALQSLSEMTDLLPPKVAGLMHLRASQINGCGVCVDMHPRLMRKEGETDTRILALAAWRDTPYYTDAERAALALTEAVTRIADKGEVSDEVWAEAKKHYDEPQLAQLLVAICTINSFNRLNVATRQVAGEAKWG